MTQDASGVGSSPYWRIWFVLLVLTLVMVFIDQSPLTRSVLVLVLVGVMLVKVSLIAGYFMHLRFEKWNLILVVLVGLLITGLLLFVVIAPDGMRILDLSQP
jgi:cytochrome c oxidase subunit IV